MLTAEVNTKRCVPIAGGNETFAYEEINISARQHVLRAKWIMEEALSQTTRESDREDSEEGRAFQVRRAKWGGVCVDFQ